MPLTPRQQRFVEEYLLDLNATQAAIRSGYSEKTASRIGPQLIGKTCIAEAIARAQAKRTERTALSADRVLDEVARLAFSDIRTLFDREGRLRSIHDLPPEAAAAIASFEVVTRRAPGSDPSEVEYVTKVRCWDKGSSLALLAKHLGLTPDRLQNLDKRGQPTDPPRPVYELVIIDG